MISVRQPLLSLALLAAMALAPGTARAYTQKLTSTGALVRWSRPDISLTLASVDLCSCPGAGEVLGSLERAAATWNQLPTAPHISVVEGEDEPEWGVDGINGVYLVRSWPFPFSALAITLASYDEGTGELLDTDVIINGEAPFSTSGERSKYDLDTVLTHELGHVLGLDESDVTGSTMFPRTRRGEIERRELSPDDVDGISSLYSSPPLSSTPAGCSIGYRTGDSSSNLVLTVLLSIGLILLARRRA